MGYIDIQLEEIERALLLSIRAKMTQVLIDVAAESATADTAFFAAMGVNPVPETPLLDIVTYIQGADPYILERPLNDFPVIAVVAYEHPQDEGIDATGLDFDQGESVHTRAYVDLLVNYDDPTTLNRLAKRYAKALHRCVLMDSSLGMQADRSQKSPEVRLSNVVSVTKSDVTDELTFFQGAHLEYVFMTVQSTYW